MRVGKDVYDHLIYNQSLIIMSYVHVQANSEILILLSVIKRTPCFVLSFFLKVIIYMHEISASATTEFLLRDSNFQIIVFCYCTCFVTYPFRGELPIRANLFHHWQVLLNQLKRKKVVEICSCLDLHRQRHEDCESASIRFGLEMISLP